MRKYFFIVSLFALHSVLAQDQATVMCYNVLNYPTGNIAGREDTLRQIINYVEPDLFLIQELKNDSGLQLILNESFADLPASYAASTFVPQQSNPGSSWKLQQAIIYNSDMFGLAEEIYLQTSTRDINRFKLYYKDSQLELGGDTTFIYTYVAHLKSSQGSSNVAERLSMAQTFTTNLGFLPPNANVIFAGDFNVYTSEEPAYEELLDETNYIQMRDPINSLGNWSSSSFQPKSILTQSTRSSSIFGDGAGGGLDDRFDFILLSDNQFRNWNTVVYEPDSYYALGNTGTCYNQSITQCDGGEYPDELLSSLYYMSDHLPVVLTLNLGVGTVGVKETSELNSPEMKLVNRQVELRWNKQERVEVTVTDLVGRVVYRNSIQISSSNEQISVPSSVSNGIFVIKANSNSNSVHLKAKF